MLHLVELFDGTVHGWERDPARATEVAKRFGDRVSIRALDAELGIDQPFDLVSVQLNAQDTPRILEWMVTESLTRLTKAGGYVVMQVATRSKIDGLYPKGIAPKALEVLDAFFKLNFGTSEPALSDIVATISVTAFEVIAVVPSDPASKKPVSATAASKSDGGASVSTTPWSNLGIMSWIVLRRRPKKTVEGRPTLRARGDYFSATGLVDWLNQLRDSSIDLELCDGYFARLASPRTHGTTRGVSLVKHDIHRDIKRTLRLARLEAERNILGVYFMMPRHDLNAAYYDLEFCWYALREIQAMGHEIGIHVDPFDSITRYGDLYVGIEKSVDEFRTNGLSVSVGNLHGNTKFSYTNMTAFEMFAEYDVPRSIGAVPQFADCYAKYSFAEISRRCGLKYWLDGRPMAEGVEVDKKTLIYVTDNTSRMTIWYSGRERQPESDRFKLNPEFVAESIDCLRGVRSLLLLHPQFYQ